MNPPNTSSEVKTIRTPLELVAFINSFRKSPTNEKELIEHNKVSEMFEKVILKLCHQSEIKGRIDEHSVINMRYPTAKRDPKNVLKVEGYTVARNEFDRISFNRIKELNQMKGKE